MCSSQDAVNSRTSVQFQCWPRCGLRTSHFRGDSSSHLLYQINVSRFLYQRDGRRTLWENTIVADQGSQHAGMDLSSSAA